MYEKAELPCARLQSIRMYFIKLLSVLMRKLDSEVAMGTLHTKKQEHPLAQSVALVGVAERDPRHRSATTEWRNQLAKLLRPFADCASLLVWP